MHTVIGDRPVRVAERRLTGRVRKTWEACADGRLPSWSDVRALDLGDDWRSCFAVDLALSDAYPYFIFLGDDLFKLSGVYLGRDGRWESTLIDLAASKMDEAALSRAPASLSDTLRLPGGRRIIFRSVLLPLSDNGSDVTHVFGAANGKGV